MNKYIVTSLEQSKRLKELGAPIGTYFWWFDIRSDDGTKPGYVLREFDTKYDAGSAKGIAAYTLSELIDWLGHDFGILIMIDPDQWECHAGIIYPQDEAMKSEIGKTPLDAVYNLAIAVKDPHDKR